MLDNVIKDIYALFEKQTKPSDEWCEQLGNDIAQMLKVRMQEQRDNHSLRLSQIGKGNRRVWYDMREGIPKEELRPEVRIKFLFGDIIELLYIALIRLAGHDVSNEQEEVELDGIKGHIDCLVDGKLVDVKSASSYSFKKFKEGEVYKDDPFGYYAQLTAYAEATGYDPAGWMVMDKQLGHLCFSEISEMHMPNVQERIATLKEKVKQEFEPAPCAYPVADGKSGNMKLATECSYCPYKMHCWRECNEGHGLRVFLYSTGPRFLTHVALLPKVPEITNDTNENT